MEAKGIGSDALTSNSEQVIQRVVDVDENKELGGFSFDEYFEIVETARIITSNQHSRVALQFPDELLWASARVLQSLEERCSERNVKICALADTSYGSCCVDYTAADHFHATLIVHYGHACLSHFTNRLSVYYVFTRKESKIKQLLSNESFAQHESLIIFYDTSFHHGLSEMKTAVEGFQRENPQKYVEIAEIEQTLITGISNEATTSDNVCSTNDKYCSTDNKCCNKPANEESASCNTTTTTSCNNQPEILYETCFFGRKLSKKPNEIEQDVVIVWIGDSSSITLRNLKMRFNKNQFLIWNPSTLKASSDKVLTRALMQRFGLIERAKEAKLIGIVVGTLVVSNYMTILSYLKQIIKAAGKAFYVYVIGKLNPNKMANFPEVDIFVLISCHENSAIDSREFYRPIITPFELQLALVRGKEWTGEYIPDFVEFVSRLSECATDVDEEKDEGDDYHYSLWTDSMVPNPKKAAPDTMQPSYSTELEARNQNTQLVTSASADHYLQQTWRGLEQRIGETPVEKAVPGLTGIPKQYESEKTG